jgi:hypothetical protein
VTDHKLRKWLSSDQVLGGTFSKTFFFHFAIIFLRSSTGHSFCDIEMTILQHEINVTRNSLKNIRVNTPWRLSVLKNFKLFLSSSCHPDGLEIFLLVKFFRVEPYGSTPKIVIPVIDVIICRGHLHCLKTFFVTKFWGWDSLESSPRGYCFCDVYLKSCWLRSQKNFRKKLIGLGVILLHRKFFPICSWEFWQVSSTLPENFWLKIL